MVYDSAFGQMMHHVFGGFDMAIFSAFAVIQNDIFSFIAQVFTSLGEPIFSIMIFIMGIVFCFFKRTRKIGLLIVCATGLFFIINNLCLKYVFMRLRPYNALQGNSQFFQWYLNVGSVAETETCFPSGHSAYAFTMATVLFFWIKNDMKKSECWMIFIPAFFIACSRVYFMVHYATDVIAGALEGVIFGCIVWYVITLLIFIRDKYKPDFLNDPKLDIEPKVEKKINRKLETNKVIAIIVLLVFCFWLSSFVKFSHDLGKAERCSHHGPDYICMNEANNEVWDEASGQYKYYCDLHD